MRYSQPEERRSFAKPPSSESQKNIFEGRQPLYAGFPAKPVPDDVEKPVGLLAVDDHPVVEGIVKEVVRVYELLYLVRPGLRFQPRGHRHRNESDRQVFLRRESCRDP